jgi:hypothetical protein
MCPLVSSASEQTAHLPFPPLNLFREWAQHHCASNSTCGEDLIPSMIGLRGKFKARVNPCIQKTEIEISGLCTDLLIPPCVRSPMPEAALSSESGKWSRRVRVGFHTFRDIASGKTGAGSSQLVPLIIDKYLGMDPHLLRIKSTNKGRNWKVVGILFLQGCAYIHAARVRYPRISTFYRACDKQNSSLLVPRY